MSLGNDIEDDADRVRKKYWKVVSNLIAKVVKPYAELLDDRLGRSTLNLGAKSPADGHGCRNVRKRHLGAE